MRQTFILAALLGPLIFISGCSDRALENAAKGKAAIEASKVLPDLLEDCRKHAKSGVLMGDRLDVAALKLRGALQRQTDRTDRCADWYDDLQSGVAE